MTWTRRIILCLILALPALALPGCDKRMTPTAAPDFSLADVAGKTVSLADFKGKSNVLIHFGTTWCPPCVAEIPTLNALHDKYSDGRLVILYVDVLEQPGAVRQFVKDRGIRYATLIDQQGEVATRYDVVAYPDNILVDKQGMAVARGVAIPEGAIAGLVGG